MANHSFMRFGRRSGIDLLQGKTIRKCNDGKDFFDDYWSDVSSDVSETEDEVDDLQAMNSENKSNESKVSPHKAMGKDNKNEAAEVNGNLDIVQGNTPSLAKLPSKRKRDDISKPLNKKSKSPCNLLPMSNGELDSPKNSPQRQAKSVSTASGNSSPEVVKTKTSKPNKTSKSKRSIGSQNQSTNMETKLKSASQSNRSKATVNEIGAHLTDNLKIQPLSKRKSKTITKLIDATPDTATTRSSSSVNSNREKTGQLKNVETFPESVVPKNITDNIHSGIPKAAKRKTQEKSLKPSGPSKIPKYNKSKIVVTLKTAGAAGTSVDSDLIHLVSTSPQIQMLSACANDFNSSSGSSRIPHVKKKLLTPDLFALQNLSKSIAEAKSPKATSPRTKHTQNEAISDSHNKKKNKKTFSKKANKSQRSKPKIAKNKSGTPHNMSHSFENIGSTNKVTQHNNSLHAINEESDVDEEPETENVESLSTTNKLPKKKSNWFTDLTSQSSSVASLTQFPSPLSSSTFGKVPRVIDRVDPTDHMKSLLKISTPIFDAEGNEELPANIFILFKSLDWNPMSTKVKPYRIARSNPFPQETCGFLNLIGLKEKPTQCSPDYDLLLIVCSGEVEICIEDSFAILREYESFFVPRNNPYSIRNVRKSEAILAFFTGETSNLNQVFNF